MAVIALTGFEAQSTSGSLDVTSVSGAVSISTSVKRSGEAALRCNAASGAAASVAESFGAGYRHFGFRVAALPTVARVIAGQTAAGTTNLLLNTNGTISVRVNTTVVGTSTAAIVAGTWYWIGWRNQSSVTGVLLQINGSNEVSGTSGVAVDNRIGVGGTDASALDAYYDDFILDNAGFLAASSVLLLQPISDNTVDAGWVDDANSAAGIWDALINTPPQGIADTTSSTGLHQIRNGTTGADAYAANLQTYTNAGIAAADTILAVQAIASTGAPSGTSPKAGSFTIANPTLAKATLGNFYEGATIAGTWPSGWAARLSAIVASPTVTLGNSPVITVTQDTSSTRIAMVSFLGLYVAYTPAPVTVTPGVATLTTATFAPTVTASDNQLVTPGVVALTTTGLAPVIKLGVVPDTTSLTLTAFAPVVTATANQTVTPDTTALTTTGLAPVIGLAVIPDTATLATTGYAPTIALGVTPDTASLTLTTFAPTVSVSDNQRVVPDLAALTLTTFAPSVSISDNILVTPDVVALNLSTFAPTVSLSDNQLVTPDTASLSLSSFAPTVSVSDNITVTPDVVALSLTTFAPLVTAGGDQTVTPGTAALTLTTYAPTVTATGTGHAFVQAIIIV